MAEENNPYAVSEFCSGLSPASSEAFARGGFSIDGELIVCGKSVQLTAPCIVTGKFDDLVAINETVQFRWSRLVWRQRACAMSYFLSRSVHDERQQILRTSRLLSAFGWLMLVISPILANSMTPGNSRIAVALSLFVGPLILILGTIVRQFARSGLFVDSVNPEGEYRIRGVRPAFFREFQSWREKATPATLPVHSPETSL